MDGPDLPEPDIEFASQHSVDLLIELLMKSEGDITLVHTGPLTNLAVAIRREPAIIPKIKAISLMGGAIGVGNTTPAAEFNIWFDPEAAAIVFGCGCPITMVPLEVPHQALVTPEVLQRLRISERRVACFAADLLVFFAETYLRIFGFVHPPLHDPCAVAAVIDPDMLHTHKMHVKIETKGEWTTGRTVCDIYRKPDEETHIYVAYALDVAWFWDTLIATLLSYD